MAQAQPPGPSLRGAVDLSGIVRRANAPAPSGGTGAAGAAGAPGAAAGSAGGAPGERIVFGTDYPSFEAVLQLSSRVPVVVEFTAAGREPLLGPLVESYGGRLALAVVDAQNNPELVQAFQLRELPSFAAVVAGQPVALPPWLANEQQFRQVLDELLALAGQNGVNGRIGGDAADADADDAAASPGAAAEPVEEPLPPHHQEAYDAIAAGDFATAIAEYQRAITGNPRDALAVAGLAQVSLLQRLAGADADTIRSAAAAAPQSAAAQLAVADLDVSGGHLDDAFARLLDLFPSVDAEGKTAIRTRLLEYFEIAGAEDPRVLAARRRLTTLLY